MHYIFLILSSPDLHNCVRGINNKCSPFYFPRKEEKNWRKPLRWARLPFRDTRYMLMMLVQIKNLKKPSSHQEFLTNNFRKVLCIPRKGRKSGTKCWKEEIRISLERLKNHSTSPQELTLKIHTNKPCSLEWNLAKMTKIPRQTKTLQNEATLNPLGTQSTQALIRSKPELAKEYCHQPKETNPSISHYAGIPCKILRSSKGDQWYTAHPLQCFRQKILSSGRLGSAWNVLFSYMSENLRP